MAGTFLCIGLSFVVVAVIILSTIGYHSNLCRDSLGNLEIEEDLPEEETEYTMDLKEYTKRIRTKLSSYKAKTKYQKEEKEIDVVQPLNAKTRLETKELELKKGRKIDLTVFSSQEIQKERIRIFVAGIIDETGKERYM